MFRFRSIQDNDGVVQIVPQPVVLPEVNNGGGTSSSVSETLVEVPDGQVVNDTFFSLTSKVRRLNNGAFTSF